MADSYRVQLVWPDGDTSRADETRLDLDDKRQLRGALLAQLAKHSNEPVHSPGAWLERYALRVLHRSRDEVLTTFRAEE